MMKNLSLCFEVYRKGSLASVLDKNSRVLIYEILLNSLAQVCDGFTLSLRHLYDPSDHQKIRSFILINLTDGIGNCATIEEIEGRLKGNLSRFYSLVLQAKGFPQLNWVNSITQLLKHGEFIEQAEFTGYLPHLFATELVDEKFSLLELLEVARCEKLVLELSLEAYNSPNEKASWSNAIEDLVSRLSNCGSKNKSINYALELYRKYQDNYSENQLFRYSIKALGCNQVDTVAILEALGGIVCKKDTHQKGHSILTFKLHDSSFAGSLAATQTIETFKDITWDGWRRSIGKKIAHQAVKKTVKPDGLLAVWDDGSLDLPKPFLTFEESLELFKDKNLSLTQSSQSKSNSESSSLALGGNSAIKKLYEDRIPKIEHLKPLHHITTFQEVIGFFQVFSPGLSAQQSSFLSLSAEEVFTKYRHLITKDTYIVGLDDHENPIISSWAEIPHRLIAGETGAGKTNFLNWIIFQFLYVNPRRKVYIADFKGTDFQHLQKLNLNVKVVDEPENTQVLVEEIYVNEYKARQNSMKNYGVSSLQGLQNEGVDIDRSLWVIDEAADIAEFSFKLREFVEKRLKEYARKGRTFGIHVLYCTQRPTTDVITRQVTDQCEEKTIFRVTPDASQRILDDTIAGSIPKDARGRAWLDGYAGRMFVNVPKMKKPEGSAIPISDTLWHHFLSR